MTGVCLNILTAEESFVFVMNKQLIIVNMQVVLLCYCLSEAACLCSQPEDEQVKTKSGFT